MLQKQDTGRIPKNKIIPAKYLTLPRLVCFFSPLGALFSVVAAGDSMLGLQPAPCFLVQFKIMDMIEVGL